MSHAVTQFSAQNDLAQSTQFIQQITDPKMYAEALGQIAVELPGSTAVFRRLKLDFCCGGQVSLETAVAR